MLARTDREKYYYYMPKSQQHTLNLCLVGFGSVNRALIRLIAREEAWLRQEHGLEVRVSAIIARHGAWAAGGNGGGYLPPVATLAQLADLVAAGDARLDVGSLSAAAAALQIDATRVTATTAPPTAAAVAMISKALATAPAAETAAPPMIACLAEAVDVDYAAGEPATSYLRAALSVGAHAVSANKGPVVHARASLLALAAERGRRYLHESAVMDGVPIFSTWAGGFRPGGARLLRIRGALNSTTSVVLSGMEGGQTLAAALRVAQDAGIAEADPEGDLSGMDAAVKVVALVNSLELGGGGAPLALSDVAVEGIHGVTIERIAAAKAAGRTLRLVGGAEVREGGGVAAYVRPEELAPGDPLHGLAGADAALTFYTDRLAPVTITQKGSVVEDTAFGLFADMIRACRPDPV